MKEIKAYIKRHKLSEVRLALCHVNELTGMSIVDVRGFGRSRAQQSSQSMSCDPKDYEPYVKIEIVCRDGLVNEITDIIRQKAYTGLKGDGKIYISAVENAIRIESGEEGKVAV